MQINTWRALAGVVCGLLLLGAADAVVRINSMSTDLERMSVRLTALERMDAKLSQTNHLLVQSNGNLQQMIVQSHAADRKLGNMQGDLATMAHKISGSFLFRGVR
jgi:hypothetical protein